jgi:hypothetical protein
MFTTVIYNLQFPSVTVTCPSNMCPRIKKKDFTTKKVTVEIKTAGLLFFRQWV